MTTYRWMLAVVVTALWLGAPWRLQAQCFTGQGSFAVGSGPSTIAAGDFNGDDRLDLASADTGSNTVSVLLGDGSGSFLAGVVIAVGITPGFVTVANLNGDPHQDIAVTNAGANMVTVLFGDGTGGFAPGPLLATGARPSSIAVSDFNQDLLPDLAVSNLFSDTVTVFLGSGVGGFVEAAVLAVGDHPNQVVAADFDGDGLADLATANGFSGDVSLLTGDGTGGFTLVGSASTGGAFPNSLAAAHLDGDVHLDLAVVNANSDNVTILLGDGVGSFGPPRPLNVNGSPRTVAVADFDRDGRLDLAVESFFSDDVSVLMGDGQGSFLPAVTFGAGSQPSSVALGDLNGDGRTDMAVLNHGSGDVSVLVNCVGLALRSPLRGSAPGADQGFTAYSAPITAVFDHSMANRQGRFSIYGCDERVVAFTEETGDQDPSDDGRCKHHPGYARNDQHEPFTITGSYRGAGDDAGRLYYDGHPGFDYRAADGTEVLAATDGVIGYPAKIEGLNNANKYHVLALEPTGFDDHRIYYLHLSTHRQGEHVLRADPTPGCPAIVSLPLNAGTWVRAGCLIGLSGHAGPSGTPPHLHLEVQRRLDDGSFAPVDPYGWQGLGADPYTSLRGAESRRLWARAEGEPVPAPAR